MISFQLMAQEQQHPPGNKKRAAPDPFQEQQKHDPRKDQRDPYSVQKLVPSGRVLVIVLRHVVRQTGHSAPPCDEEYLQNCESIAKKLKWLDCPRSTDSPG